MYKEKFAKRLKELIDATGKPVSVIAKEIKIPHQTLFRYLQCQRGINLEYLVRIADYFKEDLNWLAGRKEYE